MSIDHYLERFTERHSTSIYSRFVDARDPRAMARLFSDPAVPSGLRYCGALAAFAHCTFPLQISTFRSLIPDFAWQEHFRFFYVSCTTGFKPIFWGEGEWFYSLRIGPCQSPYGPHLVYFVATDSISPGINRDAGRFEPPMDTSIVRFTLWHPFLQPELHDPTGIYLFRNP